MANLEQRRRDEHARKKRGERAWMMSKYWDESFQYEPEPVKEAFWSMFEEVFLKNAPAQVLNSEINANNLGHGSTVFSLSPDFDRNFEHYPELHDDPDVAERRVKQLVAALQLVDDAIKELEDKCEPLTQDQPKLRGLKRLKAYKACNTLRVTLGKHATIAQLVPNIADGKIYVLDDKGYPVEGSRGLPMRLVWFLMKKYYEGDWGEILAGDWLNLKVKKGPPPELSNEELDDIGATEELRQSSVAGKLKALVTELAELMPGKRPIARLKSKLAWLIKDGSRVIRADYDDSGYSNIDGKYNHGPLINITVDYLEDDKEWAQRVGAKIHKLVKVKHVGHDRHESRFSKDQVWLSDMYETDA